MVHFRRVSLAGALAAAQPKDAAVLRAVERRVWALSAAPHEGSSLHTVGIGATDGSSQPSRAYLYQKKVVVVSIG